MPAKRGSGYVDPEGYRKLYRPRHPLAKSSGRVFEHRVVLYSKMNGEDGTCHWCGCFVGWLAKALPTAEGYLTVDHLDHDRLNNEPENLVPACNPCNGHRYAKHKSDEAFKEITEAA